MNPKNSAKFPCHSVRNTALRALNVFQHFYFTFTYNSVFTRPHIFIRVQLYISIFIFVHLYIYVHLSVHRISSMSHGFLQRVLEHVQMWTYMDIWICLFTYHGFFFVYFKRCIQYFVIHTLLGSNISHL